MKQSKRLSIFTTLLLSVGLLTFIPTIESAKAAAPAKVCNATTCTVTYTYTGAPQLYTPAASGQTVTITVSGAAGGQGGSDAGGGGGAGGYGASFSFPYTTTSTPLYLYVGDNGGPGGGCAQSGPGGKAGSSSWTGQYAGGTGGKSGGVGCSGPGGGGGAASVVATGDKTGVIAVAGGGAGGTGANISSNGAAGAIASTTITGTIGANGSDFGGDGGGGGAGGGGVNGGTGSAGGGDGSNGGVSARAGTSLVPAGGTAVTYPNNGSGSIAITYPKGPTATVLPTFSDSTKAFVGQTWTPAIGTWTTTTNSTPTITKKVWQVSNDGTTFTDISPAVTGNYTTTAADVGKYFRYAVTASDSNGVSLETSVTSLQVTDVPNFTAETPTGASSSTVANTAFTSYTFAASGYRDVYSISSGALPTGITLNSSTGVLSGNATAIGSFKYKVKVTNDAGTDETVELTLIVGKSPVFTSDDTQLQSVNRVTNPIRAGTALTDFVFAASSYPAATFALKTDSATIPTCVTYATTCASAFETLGLPDGLTFNPTTATLSGTPTKTGGFVFAIQATNNMGSALDIIHMSIASKAPVAFNLSSDKNAVTIVQGTTVTATITATGGSGNGAYSFAVDPASTSICSVASATANTATMTVLAYGNCVINGVKAADAGFAASKASITIPVNRGPQTAALVVTPDAATTTYGGAATWLRGTGGNGNGAFTWTVDPISNSVCTVGSLSGNNMYPGITSAGTCVFSVTKQGDGYFLPQTFQYTWVISQAQINGLYIGNPGAVYWNATTPPTVSLNVGGALGTGSLTYSVDPSTASVCSVSGNVLTAKSAGACLVTATKAGDLNYKGMTSAPITWTILQLGQPTLTTTAASTSGVNIGYNTYVPYVASPATLAVLTTTGGAGTGSYSYVASNGSGCVVSGNGATAFVNAAPTGAGVGWCTITVTKNGDVNYTAQTTNFQFYIPAGNQTALVATPGSTSIDFIPTTLTDATTAAKTQITLTGGLGTGAVSYAVAPGYASVCSVDATGLITDKTAGTCLINISKAADSNYLIQTTTATVTFNKLNQADLVSNPASATQIFVYSPKATNQITTTGGSGTGAVTYAVDASSSTVCYVNPYNGLITDYTAGTCSITVTKAADTNYNVTTDNVTVTFSKVNPAAISLSASPASIAYTTSVNKNQTWVTVAGGTYSTGAFTFYIDPMTEEYCSIALVQPTRVLVNGNLAGLCLVTVVQAADVNYNEQRAFLGFQITKMVQTINATSSNGTSPWFKVSPDVVTVINVTGQAGTGVTRFVVDGANSTSGCSVDQATGNVTAQNNGTCKITVSRDGDDNVAASNSVVINLSIAKINQGVITLTPSADFKLAAPGSAASTSVLTVGTVYTGTGNFTKITSITPSVCTIAGGGDSTANPATFTATADLTNKITVTAVDDGTCTLQYTKLADSNFYLATNFSASFTIGKAVQADITATITSGSASMAYVASPKATAIITGTGGSGTNSFFYVVDSSSTTVCSVNGTTGVVTDITAGTCLINVYKNTDTNFLQSATKTVTITFNKIDQAAFTVTAQKTALRATTSALDTTSLTPNGGSGTGTVTYSIAADSLNNCSISGTTVTGLAAGDCNIVVTKAADTNYNVATANIKLTITKGTQATFTLSPYWASVGYIPQSTSLVNAFVWGGGTGSGDLVFSLDAASANVCTGASMRPGIPSHIQVFALGAGTCTMTAYKTGGSAWDNSNSVTTSFTITKVNQATGLTVTPSVTTIPFFDTPAATFTLTTTGGSGTGALSITINQVSASICADATTPGGTLTIKTTGIGTCYFTVTKATDNAYLVTTSGQYSVTITKGTQTPFVVSATPAALNFVSGTKVTSTVSITGGSGTGAQTVTVDSGSTAVCSYSDVTKLITAIAPGRCDLTITKAADNNFLVQTVKLSVQIAKTAQAKVTLTAANPQLLYVDSPKATTNLTFTGGSGSGAVTYSVDPGAASVCSVAVVNGVPVLTANYYGFCVVTATKAGDLVYADATATATIRIALPGTQIAVTVPNPTATFVASPGTVSTVSVLGSLPSDVISYSVDASSKSICSVSGNGTTANVTSLSTGLCSILVIDVSKAPDGTLIASSAVATLTLLKGDQTTVTATPATNSVYFSTPAATDVITVAGGVTNSTITATVDASTSANCSVVVAGNKITMTALQVGNCLINYTSSGNDIYNDFAGSVSVTVLKAKQANVTATSSPASLVYSANTPATAVITAAGGSGTGAFSYVIADASSTICSITGNTITAITGGDCVVQVTKAGDVNYADATISVTVNIAKANQSAITSTAASQNLTYDPNNAVTTTLSTTGGSGTGLVAYAVNPASAAVCSISGNVVTALAAGNCVITATKAADPFFNATTTTTTIVIAKATQSALTVTPVSSSLTYDADNAVTTTLSTSGGSGTGAVTYAVDSSSATVCSVTGSVVSILLPGSCVIIATKATDSSYLATTATTTIVVSKANQVVTATPATASVNYSTPAATDVITVSGGVANSTITASVDASTTANCSVVVSGSKITMTALQVGNCLINFTKTGSQKFNDFAGSVSVTILKAKQANVTASSSPNSLVYSANTPATAVISATGGSGTGTFSYVVADSSKTICSIAGNTVTALTGGDCVVQVTKAGDVNYADATVSVTLTIAKANQTAITTTAANQNLTFNPNSAVTTTLSTSGGSGNGQISYSIAAASSTICSLDGNVLTALLPGNCLINTTKAADPYFNAATTTTTLVIAKAVQTSLSSTLANGAEANPKWNGTAATQLVIGGGSGTGALSLVVNSAPVCSVTLTDGTATVTGLTAGTCSFTVTKAGDSNYLTSEARTFTVTIGSEATDLSVKVETAGAAIAGGQGAIDLTVTNNGPAKAAGATLVYTIPTGITALAGLTAGCTLTSPTQITCVTTSVIDVNGSMKFTIPVSLAGSLVGGNYTSGGAAVLTSATPDTDSSNNNLSGNGANIIVNKAPTAFNKTTLAGMQTGKDFSDQVTAVGFPAVTYTISDGDLPAGLSLDPATGAITGIPTGVGAYTFTVSAYNSAGSISQVYSGSIAPAPFVTAPANGFATNTVPAGTKVVIGGLNLDLISAAIIGGKTVRISAKTATAITLEVPSATDAGTVLISLVYGQGTLDAGTFTYTGVAKVTPTVELNAGNAAAGAGENPRTLKANLTASGITGSISIPVTYTSKTPAVCTVAGDQLSFVAAGTCSLTAAVAANASFNAATSATVNLTVTKSDQSLTIVLPKDTVPATVATDSADGFDLAVTASSGLTPSFVSASPDICDVTDDGHVTGIKAGHCVVNITQAGDARFNAIASTKMEFDITTDSGVPTVDNGDPLHPTSLANGSLNNMGDVGFTWNKKLAALTVQTYGIWIGKINAVSEFTIAGKAYKCSVDFGILKAMASKTAAQVKLAMAKKTFKANAPFCNAKTEAAAYKALKSGYVGLTVKVTITRYRMFPTTYKPIIPKINKPIATQVRIVYLTLG